MSPRLYKYEPWLVFFASLALFLYGLFGRELIGFETRFALFAKEMLMNGPSFFPTTYGMPYPDYPGGLTWLNYLCALPFGKLTTLNALLPSAIASSLTLVLMYLLLAPLDRAWARVAVLLMLFTYEVIDSARSLTMDPLVMFAAMWAFFVCFRQGHYRFFTLALPLCFGFFIRGPIGLVIPAAAVMACLLNNVPFKITLRFALQAIGLLIALMIILLLAARWQGGSGFIKNVLIMQILGRLNDQRTHEFFAYFTGSFANYALSFEIALAFVCLKFSRFFGSSQEAKLLRAALLWVVFILVGMSIPEVRKIRYILPMAPALAMLASAFWRTSETSQDCPSLFLTIINMICLALPFVLILLAIATIVVLHLKSYSTNAHYISAFSTLILFALASLYILFHDPVFYAARNPKKVLGIGLASFLVAIIFVVKPIDVSLNRIDPFVTETLMNVKSQQAIIFYQVDKDAEPIQFLSALPNLKQYTIGFAQTIDWQNATSSLYITNAETFDQMSEADAEKLNVLLRKNLGHHEMVVFVVKKG